MSDQFIGEIRVFAGNFAPKGWAPCDGGLLSIQQNAPLFAVIGVTYGGNGSTTFALPDLRGRAVSGPAGGKVPDLRGSATVTLATSQMPAHNHQAYGDTARAASSEASGKLPARFMEPFNQSCIPATPAPAMTTLSPLAVGNAGGGEPHDNRQPYTGVLYCIALEGEFPQRP